MGHALTEHYEQVIDRLIRLGLFANRSEAVRAGLKELEEKYLNRDYLRPEPLPPGTLKEIYRKRRPEDDEEEMRAVRASYRPKKAE